jgi:hypothetical protein
MGHRLDDKEKVLMGGALVMGATIDINMARGGAEAECEQEVEVMRRGGDGKGRAPWRCTPLIAARGGGSRRLGGRNCRRQNGSGGEAEGAGKAAATDV